MHFSKLFVAFLALYAMVVPSCLSARVSSFTADRSQLRKMLQDATPVVADPVDVSTAPPGDVVKLNKTTIELSLDLSSDYLLGPSEDSSAPGRRRKLMSASVVTVAKCVVPTFPFKCPAPVNNPSNGALVWVAAGSTPLNTISGFFNSFTLPATTLTRAQLAPNVRLVLGVRGVDAGYEPNVTSGNSTTQTGVGSLANSGNGDTMAAPSASSAIHTYWIPKSYVAAPGATTVRLSFKAGYSGSNMQMSMYVDWVMLDLSDVTPPVIQVPTVAAKEATGPFTTMTWSDSDVTANDVVSGPVPVLCDTASGSGFQVGSTLVNCNATDLAGNVAYKSFAVPVVDTTPPVITVPVVPAVIANGTLTPVAFPSQPTGSDLVAGVVPVQCNATSGQGFRPGTTTVACSATDIAGNIGRRTFVVTVNKPEWCFL